MLCAATFSNSYVLWRKCCVMLRFVAVPYIYFVSWFDVRTRTVYLGCVQVGPITWTDKTGYCTRTEYRSLLYLDCVQVGYYTWTVHKLVTIPGLCTDWVLPGLYTSWLLQYTCTVHKLVTIPGLCADWVLPGLYTSRSLYLACTQVSYHTFTVHKLVTIPGLHTSWLL
jgi:hypothetical protein